MEGQLSLIAPDEFMGDGYIRGNGRTFRIIRGSAQGVNNVDEWNVHYDNGRIVRFIRHNRPGYVLTGLCDSHGDLLKPIARPMPGTGGSFLNPDDYPGTFRDSSD